MVDVVERDDDDTGRLEAEQTAPAAQRKALNPRCRRVWLPPTPAAVPWEVSIPLQHLGGGVGRMVGMLVVGVRVSGGGGGVGVGVGGSSILFELSLN